MTDQRYMRRALQIARNGLPYAMPNPMVGAVITDTAGRIIGEGYHRRCGDPHAEVNAINAVSDPQLLRQSTMYVTLEPCAHYGRTGPCSKLIVDCGIPNVVVGTRDPFGKVDGRGIDMMRQAGINVTVGMLEHECQSLNAIFFTAHTRHRPFVILKWAQSHDGYMDVERDGHQAPVRISTPLTSTLTHQLRAVCDGILVGSGTVLADDPLLDTRLWPGNPPRPIILDRRHRVTGDSRVMGRDPLIVDSGEPIDVVMHHLYEEGFTSILVEGGPQTLDTFLAAGLWDLARIETSALVLGAKGRAQAPTIDSRHLIRSIVIDDQSVKYYSTNPLIDVKNL